MSEKQHLHMYYMAIIKENAWNNWMGLSLNIGNSEQNEYELMAKSHTPEPKGLGRRIYLKIIVRQLCKWQHYLKTS